MELAENALGIPLQGLVRPRRRERLGYGEGTHHPGASTTGDRQGSQEVPAGERLSLEPLLLPAHTGSGASDPGGAAGNGPEDCPRAGPEGG
jgi:hypothetical protein